jgi:hypothetical protein
MMMMIIIIIKLIFRVLANGTGLLQADTKIRNKHNVTLR